MHYLKINLFYFVINIECVYCSTSFTSIHISKYRRPEKASWRINNVVKYIPNMVIWESILYNICITNQYFTLDLLKIQIFLLWCTFEKGQYLFSYFLFSYKTKYLGLTAVLYLFKSS